MVLNAAWRAHRMKLEWDLKRLEQLIEIKKIAKNRRNTEEANNMKKMSEFVEGLQFWILIQNPDLKIFGLKKYQTKSFLFFIEIIFLYFSLTNVWFDFLIFNKIVFKSANSVGFKSEFERIGKLIRENKVMNIWHSSERF